MEPQSFQSLQDDEHAWEEKAHEAPLLQAPFQTSICALQTKEKWTDRRDMGTNAWVEGVGGVVWR